MGRLGGRRFGQVTARGRRIRRGLVSRRRLPHRRWEKLGLEHARDPEIEQFHLPGGVDEDVRRLEIAMDNQPLMGCLDRRADVDEEPQAGTHAEAVPPAVVIDRLALDVLHDQVRRALGGEARVVELGDVGMNQAGEDPLLAEQPLEARRRGVAAHDLDRHPAGEEPVGALAEVDPAHASLSDFAHHPIGTELGPGRVRFLVEERRGDEVFGQRAARRQEVVLREGRREQRGELSAQRLVGDRLESLRTLRGREVEELGQPPVELSNVVPAGPAPPRAHGVAAPAPGILPRALFSQARARSQSRRTVRSDTPSEAAVSSSVMPA